MSIKPLFLAAALAAAHFLTPLVSAQTTAFNYQGSLQNNGVPANGSFDFAFQLFDALSGGNQIGVIQPRNNVQVVNGLFTVSLDFGAQFPGANRFLDIQVRPSGGGSYTALLPRQQISSSPYSIKTISADTATNAANLNNQPASFYQNAANLNAGTLPDARLGGNVALKSGSNTFTGQNFFTSAANEFNGDGANLTNLNAANISFGVLADGRLSANIPRLNATNSFIGQNNFAGNVGIGTTSPGEKVEISGQDTTLRVRNTNDSGGGFMLNTFSALQFGLYNPTGATWGSIPANTKRSLFGMQNSGRVGTLTNTTGSPVWRNTIDDGSGNATFAGSVTAASLDAANLPGIAYTRVDRDVRNEDAGVTVLPSQNMDFNTLTVNIPSNGFLYIVATANVSSANIGIDRQANKVYLKLEETTSSNVRLSEVGSNASGILAGDVSGVTENLTLHWMIPVSQGTRSFKINIYNSYPTGAGAYAKVWTTTLTAMYFPRSVQ